MTEQLNSEKFTHIAELLLVAASTIDTRSEAWEQLNHTACLIIQYLLNPIIELKQPEFSDAAKEILEGTVPATVSRPPDSIKDPKYQCPEHGRECGFNYSEGQGRDPGGGYCPTSRKFYLEEELKSSSRFKEALRADVPGINPKLPPPGM